MKKPYVYVLIDPRKQNEVFYVGKGKGSRTTHHIVETEKEILNISKDSIKDVDDAIKNLKTKKSRIAELLKNNYKADDICRVVAILDTEEEALYCESFLIHFVYGLNNLSNIQAGYKSKRFRPHNDWNILERLDYPWIVPDRGKKPLNTKEYKNRQDKLDDELTKLEDFGLVSIIDQIANEFGGDWDEWLIRGAYDVSRQLLVHGPDGHKYRIKLWGKTTGEGYICMETRGVGKAPMERLERDLGVVLRGDKVWYPFGSKVEKTKDPQKLKKRIGILKSVAQASTVEALSSEAQIFLKTI